MADTKHLMIAVNWYGPYLSVEKARSAAKADYTHGLYMCLGKAARQRRRALQYIGLAKSLGSRLSNQHQKIHDVSREAEIWLGEIATAEPSGRRLKATPATLDYAEWLHARFLNLPLNEKKTKGLPPRSVTVLNRWWAIDYETPEKRPHLDWPDLIDYPTWNLPGRLVWFGAPRRQVQIEPPDYARA